MFEKTEIEFPFPFVKRCTHLMKNTNIELPFFRLYLIFFTIFDISQIDFQ